MQHRIVRRISLGLTAGLAAAAGLFALALRDLPPDAPPERGRIAIEASGATAFARYCASCHEPEQWKGGVPDATSAAALLTRLEAHGGAPLADDLLIVQWLAGPGAQEPQDQLRTK